MTNRRTMRVLVGLLVAGAMAGVGALVVLFGSAPALFTTYSEYTLVFDNAPGITPGTPVRRSGVKIGEVTRIDLDSSTGEVRVVIRVEPKYAPRSNEVPEITQGLINGNTFIDFVPKKPAAPPAPPRPAPPTAPPKPEGQGGQEAQEEPPQAGAARPAVQVALQNQPAPAPQPPPAEPPRGEALPPGTVIRGRNPVDARTLVEQAQGVIPSAQQSLDQIRRSMQRLEEIAPVLEDMFRETTAAASAVRESVPELRRTNDSLRELAQSARATVPELRRTNDDLQTAIRRYTSIGDELSKLLQNNQDQIVSIINGLNDTIANVNRLLSPENQRNANEILKNVRAGTDRLPETVSSLNDTLAETRKTLHRLNDLANQADPVLANLRTTTAALNENFPATAQSIRDSSEQLNKLLMELRATLSAFTRGDGTVQRLLNDPSLYNNLNDLVCLAGRLLPRLDRALRDVETFADKIARHPELLGARGAIAPSAGLKDSPFQPAQHPWGPGHGP
jgi:ABC-type transporter Mla subunit MlaD